MSELNKNMQKLAEDLDKKEALSKTISAMVNISEKEVLDKLIKMRLGDYLNLLSSVRSSNIKQIKQKLDLDENKKRHID
jgi:hypothetical protein|tara:strand:+ start:46297 stop:46533 length:237 start_codon:yes stop_codon:yes gene_type:complete